MVRVDVDVGDAQAARAKIEDRQHGVVDVAEAGGAVGHGVVEAAREVEGPGDLARGDQAGAEERAARGQPRRGPDPREDRVVAGAETVAAGDRRRPTTLGGLEHFQVLARVKQRDRVLAGGLGGTENTVRQRGEAVRLHEPPREPQALHPQRVLRPVVEPRPVAGMDERRRHWRGSHHLAPFFFQPGLFIGFAAGLFDEVDVGDRHALLDGLDHVVDGQRGDADRGQRLHLDARLVDGPHARLDGQLTAARRRSEADIDAGDAERVAERDQIGRALGRQDARRPRDAENVPLGRVALADGPQRGGEHLQTGAGDRLPDGFRLGGDVDHAGVARAERDG